MSRFMHMTILACVGILSGVVSSSFIPPPQQPSLPGGLGVPQLSEFPSVLPGVVFGALIGCYFLLIRKQNILNVALFTIFSGGSYTLAFYVGYYAAVFLGLFTLGLGTGLGLMLGGLVGTKLLVISFNRFIHPIPSKRENFLMMSGSLLSLFCLGPDFGVAILFLCWQAGMAACLGKVTFPLEKKNTRKAVTPHVLLLALLVVSMLLVISQLESICNTLTVC